MKTSKALPIAIAVILVLVAIGLFVSNMNKNNDKYDSLIIKYKNDNNTYEKLKIDDVYVINETSFWVVSLDKNKIVLHSSKELLDEKKESTEEISVDTQKSTTMCFEEDNCIVFSLK